MKASLATWLLLALVTVAGCVAETAGNVRSASPATPAEKYVIGPSDVLSISVWNHKNLDRTVTVRPDGKLSFSLVGDIHAAGLEPVELQIRLEQALGEYMTIVPGEVSVMVDAVHSYKVSVMGEVRLPGRFEFQSQVSVLDALAAAGGLTEFAAADRILILRNYRGRSEKIEFDYRQLINSKKIAAPALLMPGDVVLVP